MPTRRELLAAAGAAALAAALPRAAWGQDEPARRMLPAAIDITPNGVIRPGSLQDYRVVRAQPWFPRLREVVGSLRLWADWPTLQPDPAYALGDPASPGHRHLQSLDAQIAAARQDGLRPILMPYRYPPWANGTAGLAPRSRADRGFARADRLGARGMKPREYGLPEDGHAPDSNWGRFVRALFERYVATGQVTTVEVVNEPNLQLWPQRDAAGELSVHRAVAEMMRTVDGLAYEHGGGVTCLGPSASDAGSDAPRMITTNGAGFATAVLDELDRTGFAGGCHWIWSFHNYNDVERGESNVRDLRAALAGRWRGLTQDDGPALACTEGGCRLSAAGGDLEAQAEKLATAVARHRDPADLGAGMALYTQYTITADPNYDCGLRHADGGDRPAFAAFCDALA